jgi:hypothetical protein
MKCQRCKSNRVASIVAHCSDCFNVTIGKHEIDGYVPCDMGIGEGDDVELDYCLDCGQIQGTFPIKETEVEKDM